MNPTTIALLALQSVGSLFVLQGRSDVSKAINSLIRAYESGRNVDNYMSEISKTLKSGGSLADWQDITTRINNEVDDFLDNSDKGSGQ